MVFKKKLGANPGLQKLKGVILKGSATGLEGSPDFTEALKDDDQSTIGMDAEVDAQSALEESLGALAGSLELKAHPIGNGTTVPMPYDGEDTTDFATCMKPSPTNRGCPHAARKPVPCPFAGTGPNNLIYKDMRSGLVKTCHCTEAMKTYLKQPQIVFLEVPQEPDGEGWVPTRHAEYAPLPNGQQPTPGPNQPRTPIVLTPRKTRVICLPAEGKVREFQLMRRRGDFDRLPKRLAHAR